ncbi:hypothetical protein AB2C92_07225 [Pseudomonas aeruginosa]
MKRVAIVVVGLGLTPLMSHAADCVSVLNKARAERHLTMVQGGQEHAQFRDGPKVQASIGCEGGKPNVQFAWDGADPDKEFYDLVGRLGQAASGSKAPQIIQAAKACRQQALKDGVEISQVEQPGMAIECQAYARDGGGTTITVYAD